MTKFRPAISVRKSGALLAVALFGAALLGQAPAQQSLLAAMAANGKQMVFYQWKQKTTVVRRGKPLEPILEELRFDATGQLQRITLNRPEQPRMGPLRARKAAEVKESVQDVMRLARRYSSPQQISQAIRKSEIWEAPDRLRVQARSLILPMDEMVMTVDRKTHLATRIEFRTNYEGSPVTIVIDYGTLPGGPSVMMRMAVRIPGEDIVVNVESFDFVRLAGPNVLSL